MAFKKGNEELADIIDKDLMTLLEDGTFAELAEKYELTDMVCLAENVGGAEGETETAAEAAEEAVTEAAQEETEA